MHAGAEPEVYGWVCHVYKISKLPQQGKGQGPQPAGGDWLSRRGGSAGGESAGVGDVARCCPAMPVAGVGEVLRARGRLEKFGAGATINRDPKVYTSCMANKIKS